MGIRGIWCIKLHQRVACGYGMCPCVCRCNI